MDNFLNRIVQCPKCKEDVKYGDMIWLDGECLCPSCYQHKRDTYDNLIRQGYEKAKKDMR